MDRVGRSFVISSFICLFCSAGWPQLSGSGIQIPAATLSQLVQRSLSKVLLFLHESHKATHW